MGIGAPRLIGSLAIQFLHEIFRQLEESFRKADDKPGCLG